MNRRSSSVAEGQIHVNPRRSNTPVNRSGSQLSAPDTSVYETVTNGNQSETLMFNSREPTPISYGTLPDRTPDTLNDRSHTSLTDVDDDDEEDNDTSPLISYDKIRKMGKKKIFKQVKILVLLAITIVAAMFIMVNEEVEHTSGEEWNQTTIQYNHSKMVNIPDTDHSKMQSLVLRGPFDLLTNETSQEDLIIVEIQNNTKLTTLALNYTMLEMELSNTVSTNISDNKNISFNDSDTVTLKIHWVLGNESLSKAQFLQAENEQCYPIDFSYKFNRDTRAKEIWALVVLLFVYGLIIFDLVHRTLAAILGSTVAIAILAQYGMRPTLETIISWLDVETLSLLFGMMIIVAIFSETGFFDFCALQAYKLAKGQVWPLITLLCAFSAIVSAFLDNVTTILLLTPVTIRLCEVLNLDPKKILIAEVLFSNIGGSATAIGDPPNVIIVSHKDVKNSPEGIHFATFSGHMTVGIVFVSIVSYGLLRFIYRNMQDLENKDSIEVAELRHEIEMWRRAAMRIVAISREEKIMQAIFLQRVAELENQQVKALYKIKRKKHKNFKEMTAELEKKYKITNFVLLFKSGLVLFLVILLFFIYSFISGLYIGLGWIAILGAIMLMVLADMQELETILHKVEWSTLIFFAALFSLMEALNELGLIRWIGDGVQNVISGVEPDNRLLVALLLIIWVSAIASSFIDNIPFTTAMIPILIQLNKEAELPLLPLVLALAFGACLGGNGTLIGASANVVSAGIAEQHGYGFSFGDFFRVGFPMMIVTNIVATVYLLICHVAFKWHDDVQQS